MSTFTLADLRALIDTAARKSGRTVEDIGAHMLPRVVWTQRAEDERGWVGAAWGDQIMMLGRGRVAGSLPLDLTDPGTAHMIIPLLALCHGRDPGRGGRACMWWRSQPEGWLLSVGAEVIVYHDMPEVSFAGWFYAPTIAAEPDDLTALVMACKLALQ